MGQAAPVAPVIAAAPVPVAAPVVPAAPAAAAPAVLAAQAAAAVPAAPVAPPDVQMQDAPRPLAEVRFQLPPPKLNFVPGKSVDPLRVRTFVLNARRYREMSRWDMAARLLYLSSALDGEAMSWYLTWADAQRDHTVEQLFEALLVRFAPEIRSHAYEARNNLNRDSVKQLPTESVDAYASKFEYKLQDLPDATESERLYWFHEGLLPHLHRECATDPFGNEHTTYAGLRRHARGQERKQLAGKDSTSHSALKANSGRRVSSQEEEPWDNPTTSVAVAGRGGGGGGGRGGGGGGRGGSRSGGRSGGRGGRNASRDCASVAQDRGGPSTSGRGGGRSGRGGGGARGGGAGASNSRKRDRDELELSNFDGPAGKIPKQIANLAMKLHVCMICFAADHLRTECPLMKRMGGGGGGGAAA
ncbi:hypothetical protein TSOC_011799 [Tetrabaena socialis]|uniref:Retrotransposon gag domain-containing protein n=1 Tax=Tetrabaena socialis TaxID=47790 RepID=A0A2J7ZPR3_9CHLO|nr:hypothetical protein TSOC_011799 [Tetrabaena socialis]|eukprot:PNH02242.1 hypothetical protein TSOC_011799 [Tetrabaena socialis]